jgi:RNA ligase
MIHPAWKIWQEKGFDYLYTNLMRWVYSGDINRKVYGHLELFDYSRQCMFERNWNEFTKISRGLILDVENQKIAALPFPKFFNYGEETYHLPELDFVATEKYDGSMGIIFFDTESNEWKFSTRGSMESDQAEWMKEYFFNNIDHKSLPQDCTYLCEIIYPQNRVVVDYHGKYFLVLLAIYDNLCGLEYGYSCVEWGAEQWGFEKSVAYSFANFDELLANVEHWGLDHEGVVVCFSNGYRVKVKADEYCRVHKILSTFSPLSIWESMMNCDNLEGIKKELPEEYWKEFDEYVLTFQQKYDTIIEKAENLYQKTKDWNDKKLGLQLKDCPVEDKFIYSCVFAMRKGKFDPENTDSKNRKSIFMKFRPTGNVMGE